MALLHKLFGPFESNPYVAALKQLTAKQVGHGSNENQESWDMFALEGVDIRLDVFPHTKYSSTCVNTGTEGLT